MVINRNFHFECKECGTTAQLVWENELPESLACREEDCFDFDTVYLQDQILELILYAESLAQYHSDIRKLLDERQAPRLQQPHRFRLTLG